MHQPKLHASTLDLPFLAHPPLAPPTAPPESEPCHDPSHSAHGTLAGEMTFASPEAQVQRTAELLGADAIVVIMPPPAPSVRGRLAERLDDVIERELGARGAPSPYLTEWSAMPDDAEARIADQLFRARTVGASGIAIAMGSLAGIARPSLTPEDSALLRVLARATEGVPLVVMIDDGDAHLGAYAAPMPLGLMLLAPNAPSSGRPAPLPEPEAVAFVTGDLRREELDEDEGPEMVETAVDARVAEIVAEVSVVIMAVAEASAHDAATEPVAQPPALAQPAEPAQPPEPAQVPPAEDRSRTSEAARRRATAGVPVAGPSDYWRSWAIALTAARGPQPLGAFERLFTESYMPLSNAIASGVDDPRAIRAHDEFRQGFERSYTDAFAAFGATSRRPRLVMDAFDIASKQARLHNARTTQVLVIDAMRYDLGCLVRDRMTERAPGVSLTSECLLWSALPTTTFRQLETLARGMDALRAPIPDETSESLRGTRAETVRRLRVGSRELYKLDLVPAMLGALAEPGGGASPAHVVEALEGIASSVADALLRHLATLAPRTLLLALGDHGFCVDRKGRITDGGASPEEVLVPCFAYLVADLH